MEAWRRPVECWRCGGGAGARATPGPEERTSGTSDAGARPAGQRGTGGARGRGRPGAPPGRGSEASRGPGRGRRPGQRPRPGQPRSLF